MDLSLSINSSPPPGTPCAPTAQDVIAAVHQLRGDIPALCAHFALSLDDLIPHLQTLPRAAQITPAIAFLVRNRKRRDRENKTREREKTLDELACIIKNAPGSREELNAAIRMASILRGAPLHPSPRKPRSRKPHPKSPAARSVPLTTDQPPVVKPVPQCADNHPPLTPRPAQTPPEPTPPIDPAPCASDPSPSRRVDTKLVRAEHDSRAQSTPPRAAKTAPPHRQLPRPRRENPVPPRAPRQSRAARHRQHHHILPGRITLRRRAGRLPAGSE